MPASVKLFEANRMVAVVAFYLMLKRAVACGKRNACTLNSCVNTQLAVDVAQL